MLLFENDCGILPVAKDNILSELYFFIKKYPYITFLLRSSQMSD